MNILLISAFPPSRHNIGVPSALPYYLSKFKEAGTNIDLLYFEGFESKASIFDSELYQIYRKVLKLKRTPKLIYYPLRIIQKLRLFRKLSGASLHHLPSYDFIDFIKENEVYDLVWIYPSNLILWSYFFSKSKILMTGPDCTVLFHKLVQSFYIEKNELDRIKNNSNIKKLNENYLLEKNWIKSKSLIHVVGNDDKMTYESLLDNANVFFSPHPYSDFMNIEKTIDSRLEKLTILVSGDNNSIYIGSFWNEIVNQLIINKNLNKSYKFLLIGKNFEKTAKILQDNDFEVDYKIWVDSYENAISKAQIQIFPIVIGTGTKGKVLCAIATGLYCIGTQFAFENILLDNDLDCVSYIDRSSPQGVIEVLTAIMNDKVTHSDKARKASQTVKRNHSPEVTAELFWKYVNNFFLS